MPVAWQDSLTVFPPFDAKSSELNDKHDSPLDLSLDEDFGGDEGIMASATSPFIKPEPVDFNFNDPNHFLQFNNNSTNSQQGHMSRSNGNMNVDPANLTNGNGYMSSSFIDDDELADLQIDTQQQQMNSGFDFTTSTMQTFMNQDPMNTFSHTPDGAPIQSPFVNGFNYNQFRPMAPQQQQFGGHSMPVQAGFRPHMQHMDRKVSDSRSPATPNTPAMQHLQVSDDYIHPGMQPIQHRQKSSIGNGWESTPSGHSWDAMSSPFPSPGNGQPQHAQIAEVLKTSTHHHGKAASSLPTKMEPGTGAPFTTQEAKRRRRRESHNMVERRRRDNINERIHDLGTLVPQHRLEDEKVRKHLQTNAPLSPSIANSGMSPPNSSLLGTSARRTAGNITQGLPLEEKDKGPNKGDILNGSVAWTRDMMWFMHMKLRQEQELRQYIEGTLGGKWPYDPQSDDEKRMRTEIMEVINKHAATGGFSGYSRSHGSALRVPGHTNLAGEPVANSEKAQSLSVPPLSPGFQPGGSGMSSGMSAHDSNYGWTTDLKEEDEFGIMDQ